MKPALTLLLLAQLFDAGFSSAQPLQVIGSWKMEIAFGNGEERSFRFEARECGKGSFRLLDPRTNYSASASSFEAEWSQGEDGAVLFTGPVEFPLGNVGRDPGTLILKGKSAADGAIEGKATFFILGQDPNDPKINPAKSGSFNATRITADSSAKSPAP